MVVVRVGLALFASPTRRDDAVQAQTEHSKDIMARIATHVLPAKRFEARE